MLKGNSKLESTPQVTRVDLELPAAAVVVAVVVVVVVET